MKRLFIAMLLAAAPLGASAQQPAFEPYTIGAQEHQALLTFLGEVPSKYANPIISQLMQMEQQAVAKKAAEKTKEKPSK